jgi:hypothetical protein
MLFCTFWPRFYDFLNMKCAKKTRLAKKYQYLAKKDGIVCGNCHIFATDKVAVETNYNYIYN